MMPPNGPTIHLVGHGHIDPVWLWRWPEGYAEIRATFRSALDRMAETSEFKFSASSACFYAWVKASDPEMFEEMRARVREGRWEIAGGWWVEPDCNLPSGESFVRQGLYGQGFFQQEFGKMATVGFNPDSFGHAGMLPQILLKQGLTSYAFLRPGAEAFKIGEERAYPGGTTFRWRSPDGSEVLATNILFDYDSSYSEVESLSRLVGHHALNPNQQALLGFFGVCDHGGGPTRENIRQIKLAQQNSDGPEVLFSTLAEYFDAFRESLGDVPVPVVEDELQYHGRGCYSAHSEIKRLNRASEHELLAAERFSLVAAHLTGHAYPKEALERAWKALLFNQFHDTLAGTCIEVAYDDARDEMGYARHTARTASNEAIQRIAAQVDTRQEGNSLLVFNPHPWPVKCLVEASPASVWRILLPPKPWPRESEAHVVDETEAPVPAQRRKGPYVSGESLLFCAELPPMGYRRYAIRAGARNVEARGKLSASELHLENGWWRLSIDPASGSLNGGLFDKQRGVEVLKRGFVLAAIEDPSDTWGHDIDGFPGAGRAFECVAVECLEQGDVLATVRAHYRLGMSTAELCLTLYREIPSIDCDLRVNWQEQQQVLKLGFVTNIEQGTATYETPFGHQVREPNGGEEPGHRWFDLSGKIGTIPYGLTIANDSKYGYDVQGKIMRMTLLRSPAFAHHRPQPLASFPRATFIDQGCQQIRIRLLPHADTWRAAGAHRSGLELNEPPWVHVEHAHAGSLPGSASFLSVDAPNVIVSALKQAEGGDAWILRIYESHGIEAEASVSFPQLGGRIAASMKPYEIKTLRIDPESWSAEEVDLVERPSTPRAGN